MESTIYLPFLEETGYIPKDRFSYGPEIREHCERIVNHWDLKPKTYLQTEITSIVWDEPLLHWRISTNRSDTFLAQFVVIATGTQHKPKLPGLAGIHDFKRDHFHSSRWNYAITGGGPTGNMNKLNNKTVGIIGTGASALQLVPQLARDARKLYVFQRTPSSVSHRSEQAPDAAAIAALEPGWQKTKMDDFARILQGELLDVECTAIEGLEDFTLRAFHEEAKAAGVTVQDEKIMDLMRLADFRLMEKLRQHVSDTVKDPQTAEKLKPWYPFMCKRPGFQNEYLAAFNRPNVELIDTNGKGVSHVTETGIVANDTEYEVSLLIYSTGFEFEVGANFLRRTGINLVGSRGQTLDEKWEGQEKGPSTLFGIHIRDFPNLFYIGPAQAGVTSNQTHNIVVAGEHIAKVVRRCLENPSLRTIEPTQEAEEAWGQDIEAGAAMRLAFLKDCSPGYYNREGKPEEIPARWGIYPKGIVAWEKVMQEWRNEGTFRGMEVRSTASSCSSRSIDEKGSVLEQQDKAVTADPVEPRESSMGAPLEGGIQETLGTAPKEVNHGPDASWEEAKELTYKETAESTAKKTEQPNQVMTTNVIPSDEAERFGRKSSEPAQNVGTDISRELGKENEHILDECDGVDAEVSRDANGTHTKHTKDEPQGEGNAIRVSEILKGTPSGTDTDYGTHSQSKKTLKMSKKRWPLSSLGS